MNVQIPALGVAQGTIELGLQDDGEMEVPQGPDPIGWFTGSPTPGERGPSVLAAHLTWNGVDGAFRHLTDLTTGDEVTVDRADGSTATFEVTRVEQYVKAEFPTTRVYGNTVGPELRLITCAGDVDGVTNEFSDNVVVYARLT